LVDGKTFEAKGSLTAWKFECKDDDQQIVLTISKEFSFKDKFTVNVNDNIPHEVAILAAVAVDQRFFQSQS
jgi:VCBS repeat-containing protein